MKTFLAGILGLSLVALGAGLSGNEKTVPNIEGTWVVTSRSYVRGGQIIKKEFGKPEVTYVFKDGNFKALLGDQDSYSGTYRIDATKKPAAIDLKIIENEKPRFRTGIVRIEGDTMTWAWEGSDQSRPKSFDIRPTQSLVVLKRTK